jgi:hypothetical protein
MNGPEQPGTVTSKHPAKRRTRFFQSSVCITTLAVKCFNVLPILKQKQNSSRFTDTLYQYLLYDSPKQTQTSSRTASTS